jgi:hypothetical protein
LDIYLLRPGSSLLCCKILPGINEHNGVLLEVEWEEICREPEAERIVPLYHRTYIGCLKSFLRDKFNLWAGNGSCVEEIWRDFKDRIFVGMKRYGPENILSESLDPERFNKDVSKTYRKRKFGHPYQTELKLLSKELLDDKRKAQEIFLLSSYKTKVEAGQSSVSMLNDVKEREKVFQPSRTKMVSSLQTQ